MDEMRISLAAFLIALATGCVSRDPAVIKTQVVAFPDGALVEYNGQNIGRAPAKIVLPQDENGRLTERAEIRLLPNSNQDHLYPQQRIFEPGTRIDRVPNRIMVDLTRTGTNGVRLASGSAPEVETNANDKSPRRAVPYVDRGKPTQAVGLNRWKPGIY